MKERRKAGATHSFRLTMEAARLVDQMTHPRRLGGKSRKVSDAIVAYYGTPFGGAGMPSYDELLQNIAALQLVIAKKGESEAPVPAWWHRFWPF
jgi:hypothetical protein